MFFLKINLEVSVYIHFSKRKTKTQKPLLFSAKIMYNSLWQDITFGEKATCLGDIRFCPFYWYTSQNVYVRTHARTHTQLSFFLFLKVLLNMKDYSVTVSYITCGFVFFLNFILCICLSFFICYLFCLMMLITSRAKDLAVLFEKL